MSHGACINDIQIGRFTLFGATEPVRVKRCSHFFGLILIEPTADGLE